MPNFKKWKVTKNSSKNANLTSKTKERDWMNSSWCWRTPSNRPRVRAAEWTSRRQMLRKKWMCLRNLSCHFIPRPRKSEMISLIMLHSKRLLRRALPIFLNRLRSLIKTSLKKKSKLKICPTKSLELELITLTVFNRTNFWRKSLTISSLSWKKRRMKLKNSNRISSRDTTELTRDNLELTSSTESGLSSKMLELMKIQDPWRPKRIIFSSKPRSLRKRSLLSRNNGFLIRLILLRDRPCIWLFPVIVKSAGPKSLFLSRRRWDLITKFNLTKKKLDNSRLLRKISISKWISLMTSSTKILISRRNWRTITSTSKTNSSKSWRSLKTSLSGLRTTSLTWRNRKLMYWLKS